MAKKPKPDARVLPARVERQSSIQCALRGAVSCPYENYYGEIRLSLAKKRHQTCFNTTRRQTNALNCDIEPDRGEGLVLREVCSDE